MKEDCTRLNKFVSSEKKRKKLEVDKEKQNEAQAQRVEEERLACERRVEEDRLARDWRKRPGDMIEIIMSSRHRSTSLVIPLRR